MPLLKGKENVGHNIAEMEKAGHPRDQSIAASLREAGVPKRHSDAPAARPPTCALRDWRVFTNGYHKDSYYSPAEVQKIAENYRALLGQVTPVAGLGHDRKKRLAASLGLPNVGVVDGPGGVRATPDGDLYLTVSNVPTWLGGMINAGRYRAGSVELKPEFRDTRDPGKVHRGPILDAHLHAATRRAGRDQVI